jgi:hypothetical protein
VISHPLIRELVRSRELVYIYGPPGTGKTRIGIHFFNLAGSLGLNPVYVATEAGSLIVARNLEGGSRVARTLDELVKVVCDALVRGSYVVVDTVNSYYRGDPDVYSRRMLAAVLAFMRVTGGLALGQASEFSGVISSPGVRVAERYARVLGYTSRVDDGKFMLRIIKPWEKVLLFKVEGGDLRWL